MAQETIILEKPTVHLVHMLVFTLVVAILGCAVSQYQRCLHGQSGPQWIDRRDAAFGHALCLSHGVAAGA